MNDTGSVDFKTNGNGLSLNIFYSGIDPICILEFSKDLAISQRFIFNTLNFIIFILYLIIMN